MMEKKRRKFDGKFKAKVAIEALKERETLNQLALKFSLSPTVISKWKQEFITLSSGVFDNGSPKKTEPEIDIDKLYSKIGQLEMENDFLKKKYQKSRTI